MVQWRSYQNKVRLPKFRFHATLTHFRVQAGLMSFNLSESRFHPLQKKKKKMTRIAFRVALGRKKLEPTSPQAQPMPLRQQLAVTFVV